MRLPASLVTLATIITSAACFSGAVRQIPYLGIGASLHGKQLFPLSNPWNTDISGLPVDPNSANLIASMGLTTPLHPDFGTQWNGAPMGFDYVVAPGNQALLPVRFRYPKESDAGPYPIPQNAPIEGGPTATGDRHVIVIDRDHWTLYETFNSTPVIPNKKTKVITRVRRTAKTVAWH